MLSWAYGEVIGIGNVSAAALFGARCQLIVQCTNYNQGLMQAI
jgi:hypothetical protein